MPSLIVALGGKQLANHSITKARTRIGRDADSDIVLNSRSVSGAHAVLVHAGGRLSIQDLGSKNGTFLGRTRVSQADVADGTVVNVGEYTLTVVGDKPARAPAVAPRPSPAYEPTMIVRPVQTGKQAFLQPLGDTGAGSAIELNKVVTAVGKPGECVVTCIRRGDDFAVRLSDGTQPASVNGQPLAETPVRLQPGDELQVGASRFCFVAR